MYRCMVFFLKGGEGGNRGGGRNLVFRTEARVRNRRRGTQKKVWFKTSHFKKGGPQAYVSDLFGWCRPFVKDALAIFLNIKRSL